MAKKFFHEEEYLIGLHMIKVIGEDHQPYIFGLTHDGYGGKAIISPGRNDGADEAFTYLKEQFPSINWELS